MKLKKKNDGELKTLPTKKQGLNWRHIIIIALAAFLPYLNNIGNEFVYDDKDQIQNNPFFQQGRVHELFITTHSQSIGVHTNIYRPLLNLFNYCNSVLTGMNPHAFHLVNNLLHTLASILFYILFSLLGAGTIGFVASLIFAIHPVHTEAVTNIIGRAEILAFIFIISSFIAFIKRENNYKIYYPISLVLFSTGLFFKEITAIFPLFIVLDRIAIYWRDKTPLAKKDFIETSVYFIVLGVFLVIRQLVINLQGPVPPESFLDNPLTESGFWGRIPTALSVLWNYMILFIFPMRLSADYSYSQVPVLGSVLNPMSIMGGLVVIAAIFIAFMTAKRSRFMFIAGLFFGLPFIVTSNILFVTPTIMGERLLYTPSAGFSILAAFLIVEFGRRTGHARSWIWIISIIMFFSSIRIMSRNRDWRDDVTLFARSIQTSPNASRMWFNHAILLGKSNKQDEALKAFKNTVKLWPDYPMAWYNIGVIYLEKQNYPAAVEAFKNSSRLEPRHEESHHNLAYAYSFMNQPGKAAETLEKFLKFRNDTQTRARLGIVWAQAGDLPKAKKNFEDNISKDPSDFNSLANLAKIHIMEKNYKPAADCIKKAVLLQPNNTGLHNSYISVLIDMGAKDDALKHIEKMKSLRIPVEAELAKKLGIY